MNVYRRFLHILKHRGEDLVLFEITMRMIGILVGAFVSFSVPYIIKINLASLADAVVFDVQTIFFICVFAISIAILLYLALLEIVGLCHIAHSFQRNERPSIVATLRFSGKKALHILHAYGLTATLLVLLGVLLFPILNINPRLFQVFDLPWSLYKEHSAVDIAETFRVISYFFLLYLGFRSIFTFHIFASKQYSLFTSLRESWQLTKLHKKPHELFAWGFLVPILITIGLFLLSTVLFFVAVGIINTIFGLLFSVFPQDTSIMLYASWIYVMTALLSVLVAPISVTAICAYIEVRIPHVLGRDSSMSLEYTSKYHAGWHIFHKKKNIIFGGLIAFIIFAAVAQANILIADPVQEKPISISHRGFGAVENTVEGFNNAIQQGANGIETDIQRLADGTVIIYHDDTFARLDGIDRKVSSMTLVELKEQGVSVLTIDQLIDFMRKEYYRAQKAGLPCTYWLLEIKAYEGTAAVVDIGRYIYEQLYKNGLLSCTFVGSFDQKAITDLELMYPKLSTNMYLIGLPLDQIRAQEVDAYTVEHTVIENIKPSLKQKATLFVWTVNSVVDMKRMALLGVDGIITDRLDTLYSYLLQSYEFDIQKKGAVRVFGKWFTIDIGSLWRFDIRYRL